MNGDRQNGGNVDFRFMAAGLGHCQVSADHTQQKRPRRWIRKSEKEREGWWWWSNIRPAPRGDPLLRNDAIVIFLSPDTGREREREKFKWFPTFLSFFVCWGLQEISCSSLNLSSSSTMTLSAAVAIFPHLPNTCCTIYFKISIEFKVHTLQCFNDTGLDGGNWRVVFHQRADPPAE